MSKLFIFILSSIFLQVLSRTAEEWKSRTIYELMVDRFAKSDGDTTPCNDLGQYCGGTFKGIENNLDYIQGMGFNAIWISPVQANTPGGYHGYWYSDFYKINENFGTDQELRDLIKACHERDIWVMVDIVANHIGYVQMEIEKTHLNDYSKNVPFNDPSYFHQPSEDHCSEAEKKQPGNQTLMETCWLNWLPDLDQDHPFVRKALLEWIEWLVKEYGFDGIRLDAIRHVSPQFWSEFTKAAGVFSIGESFLFSIPQNAVYLKGSMDSMLNFPFNSALYHSFVKNDSMSVLAEYYDEAFKLWPDIGVLGNFVDNHDIPRFLNHSNDPEGFRAAMAFTVFSIGIPTVYYGDEQAFVGGADPLNREPLWTNMDTESEMYRFLKTVNLFRRKAKLHELDQVQRLYDDHFYSFTRGEYFFAFTNSHETQTRTITDHPYSENTKLCSLFDPKECVLVQEGEFTVSLINKEVKVLVPNMEEDSGLKGIYKILQAVKAGLTNSVAGGLNSLAS